VKSQGLNHGHLDFSILLCICLSMCVYVSLFRSQFLFVFMCVVCIVEPWRRKKIVSLINVQFCLISFYIDHYILALCFRLKTTVHSADTYTHTQKIFVDDFFFFFFFMFIIIVVYLFVNGSLSSFSTCACVFDDEKIKQQQMSFDNKRK